ncbi:MAG: tyrosine--tRNA ligase [Flavobacteriales bacterium]|nr:tyrosine--tRNA ligase [Flavobacteriales bacterium]MDG1765385.1 tyrosine--tRNA ligase [Flavobacteriales bacterium]
MNFLEELRWRGMLHDVMPGTEEQLQKEMTLGYVGFDPTADSLHIGNLVPIMLLMHFQRAGHKPIALVGGATGMVGDPSGKSNERNMLDLDALNHNLSCQKKQLERFLDFDCGENSAEIVNNYDWFKDISFLDFIRDVGKHITVNYMMAKDSVKKRLEGNGMSFTEFSYQLVQGYDFYHLWKERNCLIQFGGSDQWGNIVTGTELIRKKGAGQAFACTATLITKADGSKFGKSEGGNVWIDAKKTSPYKFYQYWLNASDEDAVKYIRIFTLKDQATIQAIEAEHNEAPNLRVLQKALAEDITLRVHGEEALEMALRASNILFGKSTSEDLKLIGEDDFLSIFEGVPQAEISRDLLSSGLGIIDALSAESGFLSSNGEARRALKENSISVNKTKVSDTYVLSGDDLLSNRYILLQRGKKSYCILKLV